MKMNNYDLTVWETDEGIIIRIREHFTGCGYYCDVDNRYDKCFDNTTDLEAFLEKSNATYVGQDSENDW